MISRLLVAAAFTAAALGTPARRSLQVHEKRDTIPSGYSLTGSASADTVLDLRLALVQNDTTGLINALYDVSTPSSAKYGKYLSKEEVEVYTAAKPESVSAVNEWLSENGLNASSISPGEQWMAIQLPVSQANDLLGANFSVFTHEDTGTDAYLYNIPTTPAVNESSQLFICGYDDDWPQRADLSEFLETYRPDMNSSTTWSLHLLDNGTDPQNSSIGQSEATLDLEYAMGLATNVPTTFVSTGIIPESSDDFVNYLLDAAYYMLNLTTVPQTVTTSYGLDENLVSEKLATTLCNAYAALGARGVSLIFPSGDGGVSGLHYPIPRRSHALLLFLRSHQHVPMLPPWEAHTTSRRLPGPATSAYVSSLGSTNSGLYNGTGRGFPDVAAYAEYYTIIHDNQEQQVNGTSASAPVFAAIISLLNDQLLSAGNRLWVS
ncbi:peptidase S8/S53 domain-containing protein [Fomitopsis serialis]|uniref:peptidase S8/S53 domain-containing protein n=1 Tax=Fomitopsis serialis TaxID=139415 RepID=UPI00200801F8|nr:peptidase S8/S53 domain-containing protein [Neoantrodia serialis]KAH9913300.1 peptidase S8/S53 domain-containing protein [Neoantrodia serialis]